MPHTRDAEGRWMQSILAADTLTGDTVVNRLWRSPGMTSFCSVRVVQAKNALCTAKDAAMLS